MPEINQTPTDQLMEQAQIFASAWALVDGPYDQGHALEGAEKAKDDLRDMIDDLLERCRDEINYMGESVQKLIDWHGRQVSDVEKLMEVAKNVGAVDIGDGKPIQLNKDSAYGMRLGIALSKHLLGKLPITLTRNE